MRNMVRVASVLGRWGSERLVEGRLGSAGSAGSLGQGMVGC